MLTREPDLVRTEFSKEKTQGYIEQHLGCGQLTDFMEQVENSGITELLSIPIVVVLSCSLYKENKSLPKRTELIEKIIFKTIDKSLKKSGIEFPSEQIEACLAMLGKLSWESLLKQTQQLLIKKVKIPFSKAQKGSLRMYCIDTPGVPESSDAATFHFLYN